MVVVDITAESSRFSLRPGKKLHAGLIGLPQKDLRHIGHVGYDGAVFGDVSFIGDNYSKLPIKVGGTQASPGIAFFCFMMSVGFQQTTSLIIDDDTRKTANSQPPPLMKQTNERGGNWLTDMEHWYFLHKISFPCIFIWLCRHVKYTGRLWSVLCWQRHYKVILLSKGKVFPYSLLSVGPGS